MIGDKPVNGVLTSDHLGLCATFNLNVVGSTPLEDSIMRDFVVV